VSLLWWQEEVGRFRLGFTSLAAGNLAHHVGRGDSAANRRGLEDRLGLAPGTFRYLHQVHSTQVVDASLTESTVTGDAWVSPEGPDSLAILVADCLPVLFWAVREDGSQLSAAAHAGRGGLIDGVLESTVRALRHHGATHITAWIGPGACADCYEVPQEMFEQLTADRPALASSTRWGTPALNLRAESREVLEPLGVTVWDAAGCTIEDSDLFSHRGSKRSGAPEGRIAGLIWPAAP
jgi:polyphenol oxidase